MSEGPQTEQLAIAHSEAVTTLEQELDKVAERGPARGTITQVVEARLYLIGLALAGSNRPRFEKHEAALHRMLDGLLTNGADVDAYVARLAEYQHASRLAFGPSQTDQRLHDTLVATRGNRESPAMHGIMKSFARTGVNPSSWIDVWGQEPERYVTGWLAYHRAVTELNREQHGLSVGNRLSRAHVTDLVGGFERNRYEASFMFTIATELSSLCPERSQDDPWTVETASSFIGAVRDTLDARIEPCGNVDEYRLLLRLATAIANNPRLHEIHGHWFRGVVAAGFRQFRGDTTDVRLTTDYCYHLVLNAFQSNDITESLVDKLGYYERATERSHGRGSEMRDAMLADLADRRVARGNAESAAELIANIRGGQAWAGAARRFVGFGNDARLLLVQPGQDHRQPLVSVLDKIAGFDAPSAVGELSALARNQSVRTQNNLNGGEFIADCLRDIWLLDTGAGSELFESLVAHFNGTTMPPVVIIDKLCTAALSLSRGHPVALKLYQRMRSSDLNVLARNTHLARIAATSPKAH